MQGGCSVVKFLERVSAIAVPALIAGCAGVGQAGFGNQQAIESLHRQWIQSQVPPAPVSEQRAQSLEQGARTGNTGYVIWITLGKSQQARQQRSIAAMQGTLDQLQMEDPDYFILRRLAQRGDAYGAQCLADLYLRDAIAARSNPGSLMASSGVSDAQGVADLVPVLSQKARQWMRRAAVQNAPQAQYELGWMDQRGMGGAADMTSAVSWYERAAGQGYAPAESALADIYRKGLGGNPPDPTEAFHWYQRAARQGQPYSEYRLALAYRYSLGTGRDIARSAAWLKKSLAAGWYPALVLETHILLKPLRALAHAGNASAQYQLGAADYSGRYQGKAILTDANRAAYWFGRSASQGNRYAQYYFGTSLLAGSGMPMNAGRAADWLRRSALQGVSAAQNQLGVMYLDGTGVAQNYAVAAHWLTLAARQGNSDAQTNLGVMYFYGDGYQRNDATAAYWYKLAVRQGNMTAESNLQHLVQAENSGGESAQQRLNMLMAAGIHEQYEEQEQRIQAQAAAGQAAAEVEEEPP